MAINEIYSATEAKQRVIDLYSQDINLKEYRQSTFGIIERIDFSFPMPEFKWKIVLKHQSCNDVGDFYFREIFTKVFSYSIPTLEALTKIKKFVGNKTISEFMSGTGYWSFLLQQIGCKIIPSDIVVKKTKYRMDGEKNFIKLKRINIGTIKRLTKNNAIMLSWIPYMSYIANNILNLMHSEQKLILIGEEQGGCCANDNFFEILDKEFNLIEVVNIPQFEGINDYIKFYEKKMKKKKYLLEI